MKRALLVLAFSLCIGAAGPAFAARKLDPEIKKYLEEVKKQRKEEAREERKAEQADPNRKLRPYQTLEEIDQHLDQVLAEHPDLFTGGTYGRSVQGRDLRWIRLSTGPGDKPEILISGNIHAHELAGGQMVIALIDYFAEKYEVSLDAKKLADSADIYFIPVINPDNMDKAARMQSKWGITNFIRKNEGGVDLNRNFPYPPDAPDRLNDSAGSPKKRSQTHRGPEPFSEPETRAFVGFVDKHDFILSLNYHTHGGMILYAPGTYPDPEPDTDLMKDMAMAYQAEQFDKYAVYPGIDLYPTIGALDDYLYHHYGILSFTVEVAKGNESQAFECFNGTVSPIFWTYNVYDLEKEKANNVPGALAMMAYAVRLYGEPGAIKWKPPEEEWVGESAAGSE